MKMKIKGNAARQKPTEKKMETTNQSLEKGK